MTNAERKNSAFGWRVFSGARVGHFERPPGGPFSMTAKWSILGDRQMGRFPWLLTLIKEIYKEAVFT